MPGKYVFPGGRVDKSDNRIPVAAPISGELEANLLKGSPEDRAFPRACACGRRDPRGLRGNRALPRPQGRQAVKLEGAWKPFTEAGLLPDPSSLFLIAARSPRPAASAASIRASSPRDALGIAHRVEGVIHADAELVELVGSRSAPSRWPTRMPMTKNVLAELDRRPRHRAAAPRRAGAVLPFLRRQDAEGRAGGVSPPLSPVIASERRSDPESYRLCRAWLARYARKRRLQNIPQSSPPSAPPIGVASERLPISSPTITATERGNGTAATQARRVHAAGLHPHRRLALSGRMARCQLQFPRTSSS